MFEEDMPYWLWLSHHYPHDSFEIGELFIVLLDRLSSCGLDTNEVIKAWEEYFSEGKSNDESMHFVKVYQTQSTKREYMELRQLSKEIPNHVKQISREDISDFLIILTPLNRLTNQFKKEVLQFHHEYFTGESLKEPVHLSYVVQCVDILESIHEWFHQLHKTGEIPPHTITLSGHELAYLLDWNGDYEQIDHYYWRKEFNEITGYEQW